MNTAPASRCISDPRALVAIDLGAESCRVSLLRFVTPGKPQIELVHRFSNAAIQRNGGHRWDLDMILRELHVGLHLCAAKAPEGIRSIAVDGWAVDYVRLDPSIGVAICDPFCYRDARTATGVAELHRRISPERMRELTGIQLLPLNTAYQMAADDDDLRKLRWLNLPEYVLYTLGARPVAERTNASHTQLLGLDGQWSDEIVAALEAPMDSMPELVEAGTEIGRLTGPLCALPAFADCRLIAPACHDTASAIAAISDCGDDWAYISSGTWSLVGTLLPSPVDTPAARAQNFTNLAGVDGSVCLHKNVNGMWLLRQCLESWNVVPNGQALTIGPLVMAAEHFGPRDYALDVDDKDLLSAGDMPARINQQLRARGLAELDPRPEHAAEFASFLFYSLAARYAEVLQSVAAITGKQLRKLYVMGGGSQNELLNKLTQEATGIPVHRAGSECSTVGNFASQLATLEQTPGDKPTAHWAAVLSTESMI